MALFAGKLWEDDDRPTGFERIFRDTSILKERNPQLSKQSNSKHYPKSIDWFYWWDSRSPSPTDRPAMTPWFTPEPVPPPDFTSLKGFLGAVDKVQHVRAQPRCAKRPSGPAAFSRTERTEDSCFFASSQFCCENPRCTKMYH